MRLTNLMAAATIAASTGGGGLVAADRPANMSICDYYTTALLTNNTAENQQTVLTLLVNTAVIGNYTKPTIPGVTWPDVSVPGILANGTVNGTAVNLLPYFNGGLASSNRGGDSGVAVDFLDDGGAAPLMMNKPANGDTSNQYHLLTHLYTYFGVLLGCSHQSTNATNTTFARYSGSPSMYSVHKYMALTPADLSYFIQQVGLSAASFGVATADIQLVATSLQDVFGTRCSPNATVAPYQPAASQAICDGEGCPVASGDGVSAQCVDAGPMAMPGVADAAIAMGEGNKSSTATMSAKDGGSATATTGASKTSEGTGAATQTGGVEGEGGKRGVGAALAGVVALLAVLL